MDSHLPDTTAALETRRITAEETWPLRMQVLRPGMPASDSVFPGDDDPATLHAGTVVADDIVAIGSIYHEGRPDDAPGAAARARDHDAGGAWRLRGMAVDPSMRRRGAGAAVLQACEEHARSRGGTLLWCNARTPAIPFYEAHGWAVLGEEFDIPTAGPHFVMEKRIR